MKILSVLLIVLTLSAQDSLKISTESYLKTLNSQMELTRRVALYRVAEDSILSVLSSVDSVKELNKHYSKVIPRLSQAYKYKIKLLTDDLIASSNRDKWANRFVTSAVLYPSLNLLEVKPLHNIGINAAVIAVQWLFDYELFNLFHVSDSVKRLIL